jgi:hypothetical protein
MRLACHVQKPQVFLPTSARGQRNHSFFTTRTHCQRRMKDPLSFSNLIWGLLIGSGLRPLSTEDPNIYPEVNGSIVAAIEFDKFRQSINGEGPIPWSAGVDPATLSVAPKKRSDRRLSGKGFTSACVDLPAVNAAGQNCGHFRGCLLDVGEYNSIKTGHRINSQSLVAGEAKKTLPTAGSPRL